MKTAIFVTVSCLILFLLVAVIWRFTSNRRLLPCPVWLRWLVELDNPFTKTNRAATILSNLNLRTGMSVIDIGCGPGRLTIPIAKSIGEKGRVVALDIQPGMLKIVADKARAEGLENIEHLQAGAGEGKIPRESFDRALLVTVLGEIPERKKALQEVFNSLKPGGMLSITEIIFDPHFLRYKTVKELAESCGFREKECSGNKIAYTVNLEKPQA